MTSPSSTSQCEIFNHPEFGNLRCIEKDGEPWFVGKDVATALGYANTKDAIYAHVDSEDKRIIQRSENTTLEIPNRGMTIINESGLYSLILSSKLKSAKRFKRWVTSEVLPCIRKTGGSQRIIFTLYSFIICSILMVSRIIEGGNTNEKEAQKFSYHFSGCYYDLFSSALSIGSHQEGRNKNIQQVGY